MTRKPWLAAILSLLMPGLGQIYSGALERGAIVCCASWATIPAIFGLAVMLPAWAGAFAPFLLLIAGFVLVMADAARTARRAPRPFVPQSYNRWFVYLTLPFFFGPPVTVPLEALIKWHLYEAFSIPTASMAPTILAGDYIYATRWRGTIPRDANVVFRHDRNTFVKRVVGIAGDTLAMRNERLYRNGRSVSEPYTIAVDTASPSTKPTRSTWGPIIVPPGMCFVLGDNRDNSLDSRFYGFVPTDSVIKRPIGVYFSRDPKTYAIRWSRIGRDVSR